MQTLYFNIIIYLVYSNTKLVNHVLYTLVYHLGVNTSVYQVVFNSLDRMYNLIVGN